MWRNCSLIRRGQDRPPGTHIANWTHSAFNGSRAVSASLNISEHFLLLRLGIFYKSKLHQLWSSKVPDLKPAMLLKKISLNDRTSPRTAVCIHPSFSRCSSTSCKAIRVKPVWSYTGRGADEKVRANSVGSERGDVSISCSTLSTLWVTAAPLPHLTVLLGHPLVPPFDDSHTKCDATMMPTYPQMYLLRLKLQFWAENRQLERWPFPFPTINSQHFVCLIVDLITLFLQFLFPRP